MSYEPTVKQNTKREENYSTLINNTMYGKREDNLVKVDRARIRFGDLHLKKSAKA